MCVCVKSIGISLCLFVKVGISVCLSVKSRYLCLFVCKKYVHVCVYEMCISVGFWL